MSKGDIFFYLAMAMILALGVWLGNFFGGVLVGAAVILVNLVTIGRTQARKAASHMDKRMRDIILDKIERED